MKKFSILVTGGNGIVGSYFIKFPQAYRATRKDFDITDPKGALAYICTMKPQTIIHLAAMTNVDECEKHPELAYENNVVGTFNVSCAAKKINAHLIYVSTSGVFSGKKRKPYTVHHKPEPISVYTRTKYMGEMICKDMVSKLTIARAGWIFGGCQNDKKFVGMVVKQLQEGKSSLSIVNDVFGCPTYAKDFVSALWTFHEKKQYGLYHVVNEGFASRYQIAQVILEELGFKANLIPTSVHNFPNFSAPRPSFEVIKPNIKIRTWQTALKEYLQTWQTKK